MRILTLTVLLGLPLMALGQTEPQQPTQEQTKETQTTAPAKGKKMRPAQEQTKPQAKPETALRRQNLRPAQTCVDRRTFRVVLRT